MKNMIIAMLLLMGGIACASADCLQTCCERYGGTMDSHGCSIQAGDANFQAYGSCSGYCISGTAPPATTPTTSQPTAAQPETAQPIYEGGPSEAQACGIGALLLALLGILGLFVMRR